MRRTAKIGLSAAAIAAGAALLWMLNADNARLVPTAGANTPALTAAAVQTAQPTQKQEEQRVAVPTEEPIEPSLVHPYTFDLQVEVIDRDGLPVDGVQIHLAPIGCTLDKLTELTGIDGVAHAQWRGKQSSMEMALLVDSQPTMRRFMVQAGAPQRVVVGGRSRGGGGTFTLSFVNSGARVTGGSALFRFNADSANNASKDAATLEMALSSLIGNRSATSDLVMQAGLHPHAMFGDALVAVAKKDPPEQRDRAVLAQFFGESINVSGLAVTLDSTFVRDFDSPDAAAPLPTVLEGAVYDDQGHAVHGATVCWGENVDRPAERKTTDEQGHFHFDNVKPGYLELRAGGRDHGLVHERLFVAKEKITHWVARLVKQAVIRGRAVDAAGKPLEGWVVEVAGAQNPWFDACDVHKDGSFVLPNQPGGVSRLLLRHGNGDIKLPVAVVADVLPDSGELLVKFDATAAAGQLSIEPVVPDGVQGVQAEVRVWQEETGRGASMDKAEDSPVYALGGLAAGWYRVEVGASSIGWADAGRHWVDGKGPVPIGKFALPQPGRVRISYPEGSVPQGETFVQQICLRRPGCDIRVEDAATAKGSELTLPAGDYWLLWRDVEGRRQVLGFSVVAGKETAVDAGAASGR